MKTKLPGNILSLFISLSLFILLALFPLSSSAFATTIVIDPGHSSPDKQGATEPGSGGLKVGDNSGSPGERAAMQKVANEIEGDLKKDGYTVVMTKTQTDSYVSLLQRAQIANNAHADLAVSLHYDYSHKFGTWAEIYAQQIGLSRYNFGPNNTRVDEKTFGLPSVAQKSQQYAQIFAQERGKDEGFTPSVTTDNFSTRGANYSGGNIPMVQLFATVPWVYNEVGGINFDMEKYRKGIVDSIEKAVPSTGSSSNFTATSNCTDTSIDNPKTSPVFPPDCDTSGNQNESAVVQKVIALARSRINNKNIVYSSGEPSRNWSTENPATNDPTFFDCSGFVGWAWYWGSGGKVSMGGQTNFDWANQGHRSYYQKVVTSNESLLEPGDAVYFNNGMAEAQPGHVGLYIGKDPGSKCSANDCYMQFFTTGVPGDEESLKGTNIMGFIRMKGF
ncbi:MAG TPA: N-acetylmuramoyl-L-alanine amidase [Candidatus Saccharimonadales bacterium]|nr:N-acetylmuramoyl-L-alanine amidase [Candidatus Saccharimonadales bacterium]